MANIRCDECPASPPCTCQGNVIYCDHLNLTEVPKFSKSINEVWDVELHHNNIKQIENGAFKNLKLQMLLLYDNEIEVIEDDALEGSETTLLVLHIYNNKLTLIPSAIGKLNVLMGLDVHNNPITVIDEAILQSVSKTLSSITLGNKEMNSWPNSISLLEKLTTISIYDLEFQELPDDAFKHFPELNILEMMSTKIRNIPSSLGSRTKLKIINLVGNEMITTESFNGHDFNKLQNLTNINIVNSSIQTLPNIFSNLDNLNQLQLDSNPISSIPDNVFPLNFSSNFWFLMLRNTTLTTVPTALSKLTNLNRIDFQRHSIQEIHDDDFKHLEKLEVLYFTDNLLHTVSDNAFKDLKSLIILYLDNTRLTTIPKAVMNLPSLFELTLSNTRIDCTCESLGWIKNWIRRSDLQITGSCANIRMTIALYISQEIPKCK